ncbi:taurine---2-oxoglutarate transaminase [Paenibacillus sophorae]|uniref:Aminotransferase class III-fold pyridoxal phosphate-dependent enzyme n=1 Tax=Paenibacillus sophorae TaxID=1333845 RepID=A0A1H8V7V7_9BACL|nr:aminotransferase class III-fold pyridoxal phosphate-dependent enzyme [Paenibacillus sophorae]QWU13260.1 aminotransferase class III-fold pyridoxal phosphate-dependent enzyme [Paenibacillus sophorae]SEP11469.1 taurine---2-oxoglutarate transaminase [Paenibacillus sophorae]
MENANSLFHPWMKQNDFQGKKITDADGIYIWIDGKKCFDMASQSINVNIGHRNSEVIRAIQEQCEKLPYIYSGFSNPIMDEAARDVLGVLPNIYKKVYFTNSGSEANENAIKLARMYTGKQKIFSSYNSYHGSTIGAGNLTGDQRRLACEPGQVGFIKFNFPDKYHSKGQFRSDKEMSNFYLDLLREQIIDEGQNNIAAIFLEPIIGGNGVIIPPDNYLEGIREICNEFKILMVCDEVMTGWGRTGKWFAFEHWDIKPDIITTSKGMTSSYVAFGVVVVNEHIAKYFDNHVLMCGSTNYAHLLGCAATVASIKVYKKLNLIENSELLGKLLNVELNKMKSKYHSIGDIRCKGLFAAIEFKDNVMGKRDSVNIAYLINLLEEKGFWTLGRRNILMIAPPLIINREQLLESLNILDSVLEDLYMKGSKPKLAVDESIRA